MKYCPYCGAQLNDTDVFCTECGAKLSGTNERHPTEEPKNKLCCELAYSGFLFWLPLVVCPEDKRTKFCANQGLWLLIVSILACALIRGFGAINALIPAGIWQVVSTAVYSLLFLAFLALMLYMLSRSICTALDIHKDKSPNPILFFDKLKIIR